MIASKPGNQLHAQFIPFQSFANNGRWRWCRRRTKTKTKIKESMTSWMTLNTVIMVTRTKLLFVADIHINACTFIIYNNQNYKCRTQLFMIFTVKFYSYEQYTNFMNVCSCICVFTMMVLCRQKLRFPKHGRSPVKKVLCFYIWYDHRVGFTLRWFSELIYPEHQ